MENHGGNIAYRESHALRENIAGVTNLTIKLS